MTSTVTCCISLKKTPNEVIEIFDQAKAMDPEWHEATVNANIDIFEMSYE
jgi:hypothetical protein